jgi:large subunit ribosomal protein L30
MADQRMLKITLVRSPIGQTERQRATLRGIGLTGVGRTVVRSDTAPLRGMIEKVQHLVKVEG